MRVGLRTKFTAAAAAAILGASVIPRASTSDVAPSAPASTGAGAVTLLSYNVEGLPWPLTHGRTRAAEEIAARLRAERARGEAPRIVAVQEAFGEAQKAIGSVAGYRYVSFGPNAGMVGTSPVTSAERSFVSAGRTLDGETEGALEDSGLAIFSDYPIVWAWRMPFPRYACAGYDCLANKGILVVAVRVPGRTKPLIVIDTHLNSRTASGVGDGRSLAAFRRQVDLLSETVRRLSRTGLPMVLAGDFNVGGDPDRSSYLGSSLDRMDHMKIAASELTCGAACRLVAAVPSIARSKTVIFYQGLWSTIGAARAFGSLPGGHRLSDHVGVMQAFDMRA